MKQIIPNIALSTGVSSLEQEQLYDALFFVTMHLLRRGMRVDLGHIKFKDNQGDNAYLRKQRIGDQKAIIKCLREGAKVSSARSQTLLKKKLVDKERLLNSI